jgi:hypothetical protein
MTNPRATLPNRMPPPEPRGGSPWLLVSVVGGFVVVSALIIGGLLIFGPSPPPPPPEPARPEPPPVAAKTETVDGKADDAKTTDTSDDSSSLIDDDGKTLWASPTHGKPLDLAYLPPGCQIIISLRFNEVLSHENVDASFYPVLDPSLVTMLRELSPAILDETSKPIESPPMIIGLQISPNGEWIVSRVIPLRVKVTEQQTKDFRAFFHDKVREYAGQWYGIGPQGECYLVPSPNKLVIAPESLIKDIIDLGGNIPPLRRDIERLIPYTDFDRLFTIVFSPSSLSGLSQQLFTGTLTRLREPLSWFLGDDLGAVMFSADLDSTNLFLEVNAIPTLESSTEETSQTLAERVAEIPDKVEDYVVNLNAQPYGRLVIARFPEMLRKLAAYTRSGFDKDHATLRCYLPAVAAHNLLLAAELTLAEQPGTATATKSVIAATETKSAPASASIKDRLAKVTSLKFARDTLESALDQLSQDIGAPIVIRGPDLQADGITKNQSFGIDLADKPASEILVEILRLANPDKSATGASDKRQKLVYIIETKPGKTDQIVVTTRAKAAERKDDLPAPFRVEKP